MKHLFTTLFALLLCCTMQSSQSLTQGKPTMVKLHTNMGIITLQLDAEKAPNTVKNFLAYVNSGFYSNTIFHRVIGNFMIQGGGFEPGMKQKKANAPIKNEAANGLKNDNYTVAMARTGDPHSATAQFFSTSRTMASSIIPARTAGATACSAKWWKAKMWLTRYAM